MGSQVIFPRIEGDIASKAATHVGTQQFTKVHSDPDGEQYASFYDSTDRNTGKGRFPLTNAESDTFPYTVIHDVLWDHSQTGSVKLEHVIMQQLHDQITGTEDRWGAKLVSISAFPSANEGETKDGIAEVYALWEVLSRSDYLKAAERQGEAQGNTATDRVKTSAKLTKSRPA